MFLLSRRKNFISLNVAREQLYFLLLREYTSIYEIGKHLEICHIYFFFLLDGMLKLIKWIVISSQRFEFKHWMPLKNFSLPTNLQAQHISSQSFNIFFQLFYHNSGFTILWNYNLSLKATFMPFQIFVYLVNSLLLTSFIGHRGSTP